MERSADGEPARRTQVLAEDGARPIPVPSLDTLPSPTSGAEPNHSDHQKTDHDAPPRSDTPALPPAPSLGKLHKRRASASPQKFSTGRFEPLPLRTDLASKASLSAEPPTKRARIENKLEVSYDSAGTPRIASITPTFALPSGRKVSGPKLLNPDHSSKSNAPFSVINALLRNNDLLLQIVSYLTMPSLISLYAISKPFHYLFNGAYTAFVLANMRTWAPGSDQIYPWRCYQSLCIKDPRIRQKSVWKGMEANVKYEDLRDIPSLKWLQMVIWRHGICKDMLIQLATRGLRCPHGTLDAIKRMWFIMDLPLNAHRVSLCRSESYLTKGMIARSTMFFLKVDMAFTDPKGPVFPMNGQGANAAAYPPDWQNCGYTGCDLREILLSERHFTPLWRVLRGLSPDPSEPAWPMNRLDVLKLWVRHKYHLPENVSEHVKRQSIMGVPWHEVGTAGLERTGVSLFQLDSGEQTAILHPAVTSKFGQHMHPEQQALYPHRKRILLPTQKPREPLLRPDELIVRESIRRKMRLHTQWARMMLWGFCDELGRNFPVMDEAELLAWSNGREPQGKGKGKARVVEGVGDESSSGHPSESLYDVVY